MATMIRQMIGQDLSQTKNSSDLNLGFIEKHFYVSLLSNLEP